MAHGHDDAVRLGDLIKCHQIHAVLVLGNGSIRPGVGDHGLNVILLQAVDDVVGIRRLLAQQQQHAVFKHPFAHL